MHARKMIGLVLLGFLATGVGQASTPQACVYDPVGAAHAHDGPFPPEPPPTHKAFLDFPYNNHFAPCFPREALRKKHYGTVWLRFLVADDDSIRDIKLDTSSGYPELDQSALDAARHWRAWFPAAKDRVPYSSWVRMHVSFVPPRPASKK